MVDFALEKRKLKTSPLVSVYLVDLLDFYLISENLYPNKNESERSETLAEMYLKAASATQEVKVDLLKKLGDTSLYISGFFGDSLKRKIVDIDYYAEIGGSAYDCLARVAGEKSPQYEVFSEISFGFLKFVDVLTLISQKSLIQKNSDVLRLYDRFVTTGSELAKEQLAEKGLVTAVGTLKKASDQ